MSQTQLTFIFFPFLHLFLWPSTSTQEASDIHRCVWAKASQTRCHNILHSIQTTGERSGHDNMWELFLSIPFTAALPNICIRPPDEQWRKCFGESGWKGKLDMTSKQPSQRGKQEKYFYFLATTLLQTEFRKLCAKHLRMQLMKLVWSKQSWNLYKEEPWICSACFGHSIIPICVIL